MRLMKFQRNYLKLLDGARRTRNEMEKKMRSAIGLHNKLPDLLFEMSEGNPGAISVLIGLQKDPLHLLTILHLDDMNIRGSQIWVGYKDCCDCDIDKFSEKVKARDQGMVDHINNECASYGEIAVTSGASFNRG